MVWRSNPGLVEEYYDGMSAQPSLVLFGMCCWGFASPVFAQIDASALRVKYGLPLRRETFNVQPGIEMIVDYGPHDQVCGLQLPAGISTRGPVSRGFVTKQQIDVVLTDLVPASMRGKELGRLFEAMGRASVWVVEYEDVTISEPQDPDHPGNRTGVAVRFKNEDCRNQDGR
jgi:hypothetical protein